MERSFNTEIINNYLIENKINKTEFCKLCGVSKYALEQFYKNNFKIKVIPLLKIANLLHVRPDVLIILTK